MKEKLKKKINGESKNLIGDSDEEGEDIKDVDLKVGENKGGKTSGPATIEKKDGDQIDMRTVLGFLN